MSESDSRNTHVSETISSDADLQEFFESRSKNHFATSDSNPVTVYSSMRNYHVEPLEPEVVVYFIKRAKVDSTAHVVDESTIRCFTPLRKEPLSKIQTQINEWGYEVTGISRAGVRAEIVAIAQLEIQKAPSVQEELRMLSIVSPDIAALLDGWATAVHNQHRPEDEHITIKEWVAIRQTPLETIRENTHRLVKSIEDTNGIPGTQLEIAERGGVSVTSKNK